MKKTRTNHIINILSFIIIIIIIIIGIVLLIASYENKPIKNEDWTVQNSVANEFAKDMVGEIQLTSVILISIGIVILLINNLKNKTHSSAKSVTSKHSK